MSPSLLLISAPVHRPSFFFFLMIRRPPRSTLDRSSAASDVYKRQAGWPLRGPTCVPRGTLQQGPVAPPPPPRCGRTDSCPPDRSVPSRRQRGCRGAHRCAARPIGGLLSLYSSITGLSYRFGLVGGSTGRRATTSDTISRSRAQVAATGSTQASRAMARSRSATKSRRWMGS